MTTFRPHPNNVSTCLAAGYTAGSGSLVLDAGTGAKFGSVFPLTVTVIRASTYGTPDEFSRIYNVTARSGDTLTISGAIEGSTDHDFVVADRVEIRWTDGLARSIETAVNAIETTAVSTASTYIDPPWISSLAGSKITGAVTSSSTAGTITGSITYSQVSNLSSWPGSTAIITTGTITTGTWQGSVITPAKLGTNTPTNQTWLRGDGAWYPTWPLVQISASGAIGVSYALMTCDATAGNLVLTLPAASSVVGHEFIFCRTDGTANTCTIQRSGTDLINGVVSVTLASGGKFIRLIASSIGFLIVGSN